MARHVWMLAVLGTVLFLGGCGSEDKPTSLKSQRSLQVSASPKNIPADGVTISTITVGGTIKGPVEVKTSLGLLVGPDGSEGQSVRLEGDGTLSLRSACDGRVEANCSGQARISARDVTDAAGSTQVILEPLELCNNGEDDDGNGEIDCADTVACPADTPCANEAAGDPLGLACGNGGKCDQCIPPGDVQRESKESSCEDTGDNDCDGKIDCEDTDCAGLHCVTSNGGIGTCASGVCTCVATGDEICDDHLDNDCDGQTDCEAASCNGDICRTESGAVGECGEGVCNCTTSTEDCTDGFDNDCDDLVDCDDDDCLGVVCDATTGLVCSSGAASTCTECPHGEATESNCGDGIDNDCDGDLDCADDDCENETCGADGMVCAAKACTCTGGGSETACGDGLDNDCDGVVDCADSDCGSTTLGQYGLACNAFGKKCDWLGECLCPPFGALTETSCSDGSDNDCDGKVDCLDEDCRPGGVAAALPCNAKGLICADTPGPTGDLCATCPSGLTVETACTDVMDNDCDGQVDCADSDCLGQTCGANGYTCSAAHTCSCGGGVSTEVGKCGDGVDNDCDGQVDCLDSDCKGKAVGQYGGNCDTPTTFAKVCDWLGACVCKSGALAETLCGNAKDDDCDGLVDCQDDDCRPGGVTASNPCDGVGHTCASVPDISGDYCTGCLGGQTSETLCGDQVDNDCDGTVDCFDADCIGLQCGPSSSQKCQLPHDCIDSTTAYILTVTPQATRIPADGIATTPINLVLTNGQGGSIVGQTIDMATNLGVWASNSQQFISVTTDALGKASTVLRSSAAGGMATVTGQLTAFGTGAQTSVEMPVLADIKVFSVQSNIMGAKTSGYQEQNQIVFQLFAPNNVPYPAGLAVEFSHEPAGGSTIGTPALPSCTTPGCTVVAPGVTSSTGTVSIVMHSGTVADTRTVAVEGTAGNQTRQAVSPGIAIVGAKASGTRVTLACSPRNVPGFANHNCIKSLVDGQITCTVTLADRFNNVLGVSTVASFASEVGIVGPPAATPQYPSSNLGKASTYVNIQGGDLPVDVAPLTDPPELSQQLTTACGTTIHNPRDGAATVMVMVGGEEGFADLNGDGVYALGEPFVDLPEPFVDANDNNVQDGNEFYLDTNSNGSWDNANGVWDASTTMWAQTRIVYSGRMHSVSDPDIPYSRFVASTFASAPPDTSLLTRPIFDPITRNVNNDFGFVVVDANFNVLPTTGFGKATYSTSVIGPVTFSILGALPPLREEGFFFAQEYCSATAPTLCGGTCPPASAPTATRCVIRSRYGDFEYGIAGNARLRGTAVGSYSFSLTSTTVSTATTLAGAGTIVDP